MFKVGDKVRILKASLDADKIGQIRKVISITSDSIILEGCRYSWNAEDDTSLELVTNNFMSLKQKIASLFLTEPNKSRQATGITDSSNQLTEEGKDIFLNFLLSKNTEFDTEIVIPLAKAIEDEKK